ncbi:MAG: DinB family protein [Acidobacteria bacterium]|nr:DinB family protein [Acidobacteriota bacterium]
MNPRLASVTTALSEITTEAVQRFGPLSVEPLNWKPAAGRWSVAQCLDHLIVIQGLYFPLLDGLARKDPKPSFWEKHSPLSGFFGRFLIRTLDPANTKATKTPAKAEPSGSALDGDIVERFRLHQAELIAHLEALPDDLDLERTIITSPLLGFVTYSLDDALTILVVHGQRHLGQARRVTEAEGFPR